MAEPTSPHVHLPVSLDVTAEPPGPLDKWILCQLALSSQNKDSNTLAQNDSGVQWEKKASV